MPDIDAALRGNAEPHIEFDAGAGNTILDRFPFSVASWLPAIVRDIVRASCPGLAAMKIHCAGGREGRRR